MQYMVLRRTLCAVLSSVGDTNPAVSALIDPAYEANEILRVCAGLSRADLLLRGQEEAPSATEDACLAAAKRRLTGEPLAYILGKTPFFGAEYKIAPGCLIPRADTEVLVEEAIAHLPRDGVLWDLCTGSGCVPCAVLLARADIPYACGVELYDIPLTLAAENGKALGLSGRFFPCRGDVLRGDAPKPGKVPAVPPALITANPPYIPEAVCRTLDLQVQKEPVTALCGGEDGMDFYRAILTQYAPQLADGGAFLFEIGYDQGAQITSLAKEHGFLCTIRRDYGGNDRTAYLRREER